jgi:cytochrome P450
MIQLLGLLPHSVTKLVFLGVGWNILLGVIVAWIARDRIPGVPKFKGHFLFGTLPYVVLKDRLRDLIAQLVAAAGDLGLSYCTFCGQTIVLINDPALARDTLALREEFINKGDHTDPWSYVATFHRLVGESFLSDNAAQVKELRSAMASLWNSTSALADNFSSMVGICQHHVDRLTATSGVVQENLSDYATDLAINHTMTLLFDMQDVHMDRDEVMSVLDHITSLVVDVHYIARHNLRALLPQRWFPNTTEKQLSDNWQRLVDKQYANVRLGNECMGNPISARLEKLRQTIETLGITRKFMASMLLGMYRYGGILLPWALWELNRHPQVYQQLLNEIKHVFPSGIPEELSFAKVQNDTPYLDAVLHEISRLYSPIYVNARVVGKEFEVVTANGQAITLPIGAILWYPYMAMHRDPRLWGPDAATFNPERFLKDGHSLSKLLFSFGYGPRACPGFRGEWQMMKVFLILLLRHHDILMDSTLKQTFRFSISMEPAKAFKFTVRKREGVAV